MKQRQIKAWPETVHYLPSTTPFQRLAGHENDIRIDFSECKQVTTTGLTVLLLSLLRLLQRGKSKRGWETDNNDNNPVFDTIINMGFFHHLNKYCTNNSIFTSNTNYAGPFYPTVHKFLYGRKVTSYPIICLDFTNHKNNRRNVLKEFRMQLFKHLIELESTYHIHTNQLVAVLVEMAKNSADHTNGDAFFGMDIIHILENNTIELHFVLGDVGIGIKQHIQDHLPTELKISRGEHWSLYESYRYALKHGYTSTPERNDNKGIGMSLIVDGAKGINMSLSVFDANSRGILSSLKSVTHEELRRHFIAFTKDNSFYYYGHLESEPL
jgi:hypothetical protein